MSIAARRRYRHAAGQAIGLPPFVYFPFHLFTLFICTTRVAYATLAMYIGRSLRGGRKILTGLPPAHSLCQFYTVRGILLEIGFLGSVHRFREYSSPKEELDVHLLCG